MHISVLVLDIILVLIIFGIWCLTWEHGKPDYSDDLCIHFYNNIQVSDRLHERVCLVLIPLFLNLII